MTIDAANRFRFNPYTMSAHEVSDDEIDALISDIHDWYGYNFRNYAKASFKRRVQRLIMVDRLNGYHALHQRLKSNPGYLQHFVEELSVNVTEMFRDPHFYKVLRSEILPLLATKPFIRIWHAGCSSGEEVYSMAVLLKEANLLDRALLYATDLSPRVLSKAREGIFPLNQMKLYSENYLLSGGQHDFSRYYTAAYGAVKFDESLTKNMIFSSHNLVSDSSFNQFQLIVCRNVLIYFDKDLQNSVLRLFDASLEPLGFLALGSKENIKFSPLNAGYKKWSEEEKIWRKRR